MASWQVAIQTRGNYGEILNVARWAQRVGLAALALPDHYLASSSDFSLPAWDHLIHFGGLARETKTIELVDLVSPITFRHPAVYAKTAVTLADMSQGRFVLGLGTGWLEDEHRLFGIDFPPQGRRFDMLEESIAYLHALKNHESFEGRIYRLEQFETSPPFDMPIVTGGMGMSRTPRLAGRYCDEFNIFPNQAGDVVERIGVCREAAIAAGRDPGKVRLSYTFVPIAGVDEDRYHLSLEKEAAERKRTPDELEARLEARGIPHGPAALVSDQLSSLAAAGISRFYLQCESTDPLELEEIVAPFLPGD
jgi:alkanesulfonate monooxygenase SsuD/methylene tetrahydromethanopterin reductase-like flavin-dependent oxidoreductase (luciferase family)